MIAPVTFPIGAPFAACMSLQQAEDLAFTAVASIHLDRIDKLVSAVSRYEAIPLHYFAKITEQLVNVFVRFSGQKAKGAKRSGTRPRPESFPPLRRGQGAYNKILRKTLLLIPLILGPQLMGCNETCVDTALSTDFDGSLRKLDSFSSTPDVPESDLFGVITNSSGSSYSDPVQLRVLFPPEEVTEENSSIKTISSWTVGYGDRYFCNNIELADVPVEIGQSKTYALDDIGIDLKRQSLSVINETTEAPVDLPVLTAREKFVGWSYREPDALLVEKSQDDSIMYVFSDPLSTTPLELKVPYRNLHFLDSEDNERFLASLYKTEACTPDEAIGTLVQFFDNAGKETISIRAYVEAGASETAVEVTFLSWDARTEATAKLFSVVVSPPPVGTRADPGYLGDYYDTAISQDGSRIFFTLKPERYKHVTANPNDSFLLSLNEKTMKRVKPDEVDFVANPPAPMNASPSGGFTTQVISQQWRGSLILSVAEKGQDYLFQQPGGTGDLITYSYELSIASGESNLSEAGSFQLGFTAPYCFQPD